MLHVDHSTKSPRAVQAELYSLSAELLVLMDGLSAEYLATQALDIFGASDRSKRPSCGVFCCVRPWKPSNDPLYLAAQRSDDDFLGTTFSYCPTFHQLAVYLNVQAIVDRLTAITSPI
jgi:hypothetical protein